ncbi:hypothetical protein [Tenacibaculum maritimum]|uniref:hypothetical protein n=1 Tax=Tenacibaculum maritimum TaxID=107401 RepID=UPI00387699BA
MAKNKYNNIYQKFKNDKQTEGFRLDGIYEVFLPFWFCKQKIVVEKDVELDRFSKIILELVNNGIISHSGICSFLGIKEDDFVTMQFHYLIKNGLLDEEIENGLQNYQITHEGISFLKNKTKTQNMETIDFEYFYNDLSKEYFDPDNPIDKNISQQKRKRFSGYRVVQTHKLNRGNLLQIPHKNKPVLSNIKQSDFAQFFNSQKKDMAFYDYDSKKNYTHKRSILFLLLDYVNDENQHDIEIRQFKGYALEEKLSTETSKYIKKNNDFINELKKYGCQQR